ncbi:MAG: hypothetical protein G8345_12020 [Magnetococcales bacterium]|nr:hypothetical protein [Magnetococcales bacterium]NGZ27598.1 hypothetical protein [Magnetococcales bacterium]
MKYDLEKMLEEIKADDAQSKVSRKKQLSQKEIQAMVEKRRKKVTPP